MVSKLLGYDLKNLNAIEQNMEGIDLVDEKQMNHEIIFRYRLEKSQTKTAYEIALEMVEDEIEFLNLKKSEFNLNESLEQDLDQLNVIKYQINKTGSYITKLEIRKSLIEESQRELNQSISSIDLEQLRVLYSEVSINYILFADKEKFHVCIFC